MRNRRLNLQKIDLFDFAPVSVVPKQPPEILTLDFKTPATNPRIFTFRRPVTDTDYRTVMESVLANLIAELDRVM